MGLSDKLVDSPLRIGRIFYEGVLPALTRCPPPPCRWGGTRWTGLMPTGRHVRYAHIIALFSIG